MKAKEFDEIMKSILESPPDFPVDEAARADMAQKLGNHNQLIKQNTFRRFWLPSIAASILIPVLFITWSFYSQLNHANERIDTLNAELKAIAALKADTVIQEKIIYTVDTVVKVASPPIKTTTPITTRLKNIGQGIQKEAQTRTLNQERFVENALQNDKTPIGFIPSEEELLEGLIAHKSKNKSRKKQHRNTAKIKSPAFPRQINSAWAAHSEEDFEMVPMQQERNNIHFQPIDFSAGPSFGLGHHPLAQGLKSLGTSFGFRIELQFVQQISLISGWEYLQLNAFIDKEEALMNFPIVAPYDPADTFQEMEVDFTSIQIPLGIKFNLFQANRLHPYFGAGVLVQSNSWEKYRYQYRNDDHVTYYLNNDLEYEATKINNFFGLAGATFDWNDNWSLQVEGNLNFTTGREETFRFTSLRTSILYHF